MTLKRIGNFHLTILKYEIMVNKTSTDDAPWFIVPADNKWFTRVAIAGLIADEFGRLNFSYPTVTKEQKAKLQQAREMLLNEKKDR